MQQFDFQVKIQGEVHIMSAYGETEEEAKKKVDEEVKKYEL